MTNSFGFHPASATNAPSPTNQAVNNICVRFGEMGKEERYLKIRVHPEQFEFAEVWRYNPQKPSPTGWTATRNKKRFEKFGWENSLACNILKVAGCLPTTNVKLLETRKDFKLLGELLRTLWRERSDEDKKLLQQCIKTCAGWLCDRADVVFVTCITMCIPSQTLAGELRQQQAPPT